MKFYVVVGYGPNSVEVPCLIFSTYDKALQYMLEHVGVPRIIKNTDIPCWNVEHWERLEEDDRNEITKFYTKYYDGCGGVYSLMIKEVEEGTPFVGFDLD